MKSLSNLEVLSQLVGSSIENNSLEDQNFHESIIVNDFHVKDEQWKIQVIFLLK